MPRLGARKQRWIKSIASSQGAAGLVGSQVHMQSHRGVLGLGPHTVLASGLQAKDPGAECPHVLDQLRGRWEVFTGYKWALSERELQHSMDQPFISSRNRGPVEKRCGPSYMMTKSQNLTLELLDQLSPLATPGAGAPFLPPTIALTGTMMAVTLLRWFLEPFQDLWHRLTAVAPIRPLAWELPFVAVAALKSKKKKSESPKMKWTVFFFLLIL